MRFLHAADIHLDAQLQGLAEQEGAPVDLLRSATRRAFENLIDLALRERVDFVVIAGDLFDRDCADMRTWIWTAEQFRRLQRSDIPVYLIRGNHDSLGEGSQRVQWPDNVHEFRGDAPETKLIESLQTALHGQSFPSRSVPQNLAAGYPDPVRGAFNIGLLHTSLGGNARHETYAPTSADLLKLKGYDYWALGHIHTRQRVLEEPAILFTGCTQGRHINEPGEKGCVIVAVERSAVREVTFHPLDVVRWGRLMIPLESSDDSIAISRRVRDALATLQSENAGRPLAVRIALRGPCGCHRELLTDRGREECRGEIQNVALALGDIWIEQVEFHSSPPIDVEQLREAPDLLGELLRDVARLREASEEELLAFAGPVLESLAARAGGELERAQIALQQPDVLRAWLEQSEGVIVDALSAEENEA